MFRCSALHHNETRLEFKANEVHDSYKWDHGVVVAWKTATSLTYSVVIDCD